MSPATWGRRAPIFEALALEPEDAVEAFERAYRCLVLPPEVGEARDRSRKKRRIEQK